MLSAHHTERHGLIIKDAAKRIGFSFCGFSRAEFLEEEAPRLENWLNQKHHGKMVYMENHFDKRLDPRKLVPDAKSVISLLYNYFPGSDKHEESELKISKYAAGEDYHHVIKSKLKELMAVIRDEIGDVSGRLFVDSAPVLDKVWAKKSGLGWVGKNSNLINKDQGSFFFIAEIILDLDLPVDQPVKDYCGTCTACIDACPTDAIIEPYVVDGSKCISYFTIELRESILPEDYKGKFSNWIFGCDVCQDVCPWNRFSRVHNEPLFNSVGTKNFSSEEWLEMTDEIFKEVFGRSAIQRTGLEGMKRNIRFILSK